MYLALKDFQELFQETRGVQDDLLFFTVSDHSNCSQPRGVFIPLNKKSGELADAITNGAIAAIWDKAKKIPHYTPNHFPLFFTDDPAEAARRILQFYIEKLDGEADKKMKMTAFDFINKKLLNKNNETYDIAVMLKHVLPKKNSGKTERRG
jgi:UDP-N-acetylmuramyl pentapeptide synthase